QVLAAASPKHMTYSLIHTHSLSHTHIQYIHTCTSTDKHTHCIHTHTHIQTHSHTLSQGWVTIRGQLSNHMAQRESSSMRKGPKACLKYVAPGCQLSACVCGY